MKKIIEKILYQAKYDGFIHFIDGNKNNFYRNNIKPISFYQALSSIHNSNFVSDWDASISKEEKMEIMKNKDKFFDELQKRCDTI